MQVQTTTDYGKFRVLTGNRSLDEPHVQRLGEAIALRPELVQAVPILVNDRFEVIDGQHRLEVLKRLKKPVSYIQMEGLELSDVHTLNSTAKLWTPEDYAESYARLGNPSYQTYLQVRRQFPYGHNIIMSYLTGSKHKSLNSRFKKGLFEIKDIEAADTNLNRLDDIRKVAPSVAHRSAFALAMLRVFESDVYDHDHFMRKLGQAGHLIVPRESQADYLRDIESVYNFKSQTLVRLF